MNTFIPTPAAKPLTQPQLVAKLAAAPLPPRTCGVMDFLRELERVEKRIIFPINREIMRYHKGKEWQQIQALHAEKDAICGSEWHKIKRRRIYWCTDEARAREVKNEIARRERYTFKDGVKVESMFHSSLFTQSLVTLVAGGDVQVLVFDKRFTYGTMRQQVRRYQRAFTLPGEFVRELEATAMNRLRQGASFEQFREVLERLPLEAHVYDRASKLKALAALCAA